MDESYPTGIGIGPWPWSSDDERTCPYCIKPVGRCHCYEDELDYEQRDREKSYLFWTAAMIARAQKEFV